MPLPLSPRTLARRLRPANLAVPVTLVYLFGSQARGTADAESDVDLPVLATPRLGKAERGKLRLRLMPAYAEALGLPLTDKKRGEMVAVLRQLAGKVDLRRYRKHPRKPKKVPPKRVADKNQPHIATARLLEQRRKSKPNTV